MLDTGESVVNKTKIPALLDLALREKGEGTESKHTEKRKSDRPRWQSVWKTVKRGKGTEC